MKCLVRLLSIMLIGLVGFFGQAVRGGQNHSAKTLSVPEYSVENPFLDMAFSESVGSDDSTYHFQHIGTRYSTNNPAHNLSVDLAANNLTISFGEDTWQLSSDNAANDFTLADNRLTIHRDGFDEWYVNGPVGLQQGFTLYEPSVISFHVGGTLPTTASAQILQIGDSLTFFGLLAFDSTGQTVPVQFDLQDNYLVYAYNDHGATYPLTIDPWLQTQKLTASDAAAGNWFGWSVAISGDTALIGSHRPSYSCTAGANCGSAYVFTRTANVWSEQAKLTADDAAAGDYFGWSVALSGDTALIGTRNSDCPAGVACGSAYVFTRTADVWAQQAKLTADDADEGDIFGTRVALDGNTALVGASGDDCVAGLDCGSAYVFTRTAGVWSQQAKLTADDADEGDIFGTSVALDGDTVVIGASGDDCTAGPDCGSAYVFTRTANVWSQQQKLVANDAMDDDLFGYSVALQGDTALIGASGDDCTPLFDCGSAYVFTRTANVWSQQQKLTDSISAGYDVFGHQVALYGDKMLIAAFVDDCGPSTIGCGLVYVFTVNGSTWSQQARLTPDGSIQWGDLGNGFGYGLALSNDTALIGDFRGDCTAGAECGIVHVFSLVSPTLQANAACNGPDLEVNIFSGEGPFHITASAGINMPIYSINASQTIIIGPEKWDDVTVAEYSGDLESINLGQFKCRSDERPLPQWPPHQYHTTNPHPYFEWSSITDANNYRVFLFDDANSATRTVDIRQNSSGPTNLTLSQTLNPDRYFWRVRGRQNRVWSLWSIRFTLFVDPPAIAPFTNSTPIPIVRPNSRATMAPLPTSEPPSNDTPTLPAPPNSR